MLIIPVMLSIRKNIVKEKHACMVDLVEGIAKNLDDPVAVVQRTSTRLILEIKKHFEEETKEIVSKIKDRYYRHRVQEILGYTIDMDESEPLKENSVERGVIEENEEIEEELKKEVLDVEEAPKTEDAAKDEDCSR